MNMHEYTCKICSQAFLAEENSNPDLDARITSGECTFVCETCMLALMAKNGIKCSPELLAMPGGVINLIKTRGNA